MNNPNASRSLLTPYMANRVLRRTAGYAYEALKERTTRKSEYDWDTRVAAGQALLAVTRTLVKPNLMFVAVEHASDSHYQRKSAEASGCPVLMAKHGHIGRFVLGALKDLSDGEYSLQGVIYTDATRSHQDELYRTRFDVQTGNMVSFTRFTDVQRGFNHDDSQEGLRRSGSLSTINELSNLLAGSLVSHDAGVIAASVNHYGQRVAQYDRAPGATVIALPLPRTEQPVQQTISN